MRLTLGSVIGHARASTLLAVVSVAACTSAPTATTPVRPLGPGEQWLRVIPASGLCAGGGTLGDVRLHGSPTDWRHAWATLPDGRRVPRAWVPGTSARFTPNLEVIGPDGKLLAQEGDAITGTCSIGDDTMAQFGTEP